MDKNPNNRLGVEDKSLIKKHPFFKDVDFIKIYNKEI